MTQTNSTTGASAGTGTAKPETRNGGADTPPTTQTSLTGAGWASDTLVLAALSALGYVLPYLYELGFCMRLGIPVDFIEVNLSLLLFTFVFAVLLALVWAGQVFLFSRRENPGFPAEMTGTGRFFLTFLMVEMAVLMAAFMRAAFVGWVVWLIWFVVVFVGVAISGVALYHHGGHPGWMKSFLRLLEHRMKAGALCIGLALPFAFAMGMDSAARTTSWAVMSGDEPRVVLRIYGDKLVCARYDPDKKQVFAEFSIFKVGDDPKLTLTPYGVGPIKLLPSDRPITPPATAPATQPAPASRP